jgi:hypothetical protein
LAVRDGDWKLAMTYDASRVELHQLINERAEAKDVSQENPEVVTGLSKLVLDWKASLPEQPDPECISKVPQEPAGKNKPAAKAKKVTAEQRAKAMRVPTSSSECSTTATWPCRPNGLTSTTCPARCAAVETCGIVEMMHSCEEMLKIDADLKWAGRCEHVAFNSLPKTTPDFMGQDSFREGLDVVSWRPGLAPNASVLQDDDAQFRVPVEFHRVFRQAG